MLSRSPFGLAPMRCFIAIALLFLHLSRAQFPNPANGANLTTVKSPLDSSITISYTEPNGVCKTAFDSQKQLTGWVHVPGDYPANLFFWFVAGRDTTSMLSVYLNGGPGSSSLFGMFAEAGPCEIVETSATQLGTVAREWGWDRASNMLFIDQPVQVGFSYDTATNGSIDLATGTITVPPQQSNGTAADMLVRNGTFSSQSANSTANTTSIAAKAIYHFMQGFLAQFPEYNPPSNSSLGVNLFSESYGGHYGPVFAYDWQVENARRRNGTLSNSSTVDIHLASVGILNGCVDDLISAPYYAAMMVNNSYGFQAMSPLQATLVNASFYTAGGCRDRINACRTAVAASDPGDAGTSAQANAACAQAQTTCSAQLLDTYSDAGRSYYDIAHSLPDSFPPSYYVDYLNRASVQSAIGAAINFTDTSPAVNQAFRATGDYERGGPVAKLAALLNQGVRVGLVYGDRDYICNWLGGQATSLAIAQSAGGAYATRFAAAGYAPIIVNDSYIGGVVRQFANLSFSRIYHAGHFVPASQPETAFQVFARIVLGTDIGTGEPIDLTSFNTSGPANATSTFSLPTSPPATCYVANAANACAASQLSSLRAGRGAIINGVWYPNPSNWPGPDSAAASSASVAATASASGNRSATGGSGGAASSIVASSSRHSLTGVYTATATPGAAPPGRTPPSILAMTTCLLVSWLFFCIGTLV